MGPQRSWPVSRLGLTALVIVICVVVMRPSPLQSQSMSRRATTVAAILRYPVFYHDKSIALVGTPIEVAGQLAGLPIEAPRHFIVVPRTGQVPSRQSEFRGRLLDVGRFASDDSRLGPLDIPRIVTATVGERWPARQQLFVMLAATWTEADVQPIPTLRNIALQPARFEGKTVVVRGRFRGRNLMGDLPAWPRQSQWDFVLQTSDAAVWVVDKRPRGDGFDLSPTSRAQTGRWLEVTGRVQVVDDLPLIFADRLRTAEPEDDREQPEETPVPPQPAPEVIFSAPALNETGIARDVVIQIQFSRPLRPESLEPNIRVRYAQGVSVEVPEWRVTYRPGPVAAEIRFVDPLAAGVAVIVDLGQGIEATDGVGLTPTTLRFTTSGGAR